MTTTVFGSAYAAAYDALYEDKDYDAECDLLERVFEHYAQRDVRRVLDLGCGTGGHALRLAQRGYDVVGVDRSADMLRRASVNGERQARFVQGDVTSVDLGERFDAALMMFAVLGYQVDNAAAQAALSTARRHLDAGGLLFCDVWYGPAVLAQRPSERVRVIEAADGGQVIRVASSELDTLHDMCTVRYRLWHIANGAVRGDIQEQHPMRYFFAPELELLLAQANFELVHLGAFPQLDEAPSESTWNVALVARAVF